MLSSIQSRRQVSRPVMGAAGAPPFATPPPSDVSTFLYVLLLLGGIVALRCAPFEALTRAPPSLLHADTSASLYSVFLALILVAYLPAAAGLAQRGGGQPLLLIGAVVTFVIASAPVASILRFDAGSDPSEIPRLVLADLALAGWLSALCKDWRAFVPAALLYVAIVLVQALAPRSAARLALELVVLVGLHYDLAAQPQSPRAARTSETVAWRVVALVVGVPLSIVALTPLLLAGGHVWGGLDERLVNHHGMPYYETRHATLYPSNVSELQALVTAHTHVRAAGSGHSWSSMAVPRKHGIAISTALMRSLRLDNATHVLTGGAGATFGSVQTYLYRHGRQLASNWHGAVTLGGGVAAGSNTPSRVSSLPLLLTRLPDSRNRRRGQRGATFRNWYFRTLRLGRLGGRQWEPGHSRGERSAVPFRLRRRRSPRRHRQR